MADDRCDLLCLDLPKAEAIRSARPSEQQARMLASGFRALRDPTRLRVGVDAVYADRRWQPSK